MSEENKALVRRFYEEAFVKGNVAALDALSAADFIDHSPMPGQPPGVAGMKQMVSQFQAAFGDIKVNIAALVAENDLVASHNTCECCRLNNGSLEQTKRLYSGIVFIEYKIWD